MESLITKISNSKNLDKLYDLMVNDKESSKLKKRLKVDELSKIQNIKSKDDYEVIINEIYVNPSKKLKQVENIYIVMQNLMNEFNELNEYEELEKKYIFESAGLIFLDNKNKKMRIPNPDDCFNICQAQYNSTVSHAWNQFLATSAGCVTGGMISGGPWGFVGWAACEVVAGWIYDDQFQAANESYGFCFDTCNLPPVRP